MVPLPFRGHFISRVAVSLAIVFRSLDLYHVYELFLFKTLACHLVSPAYLRLSVLGFFVCLFVLY